MTRDHVGFDHEALIDRLFKCCVEEFGSKLAAHDAQTVERFLTDHVSAHGGPALYEVGGVDQLGQRCSDWPCRLSGLAYAWFDLTWYFEIASQADEAEARLVAAEGLPATDPRRLRREREADKL